MVMAIKTTKWTNYEDAVTINIVGDLVRLQWPTVCVIYQLKFVPRLLAALISI